MVNLRYYETKKIEQSAHEIVKEFSSGLMDGHEHGYRLSRYVFRSPNGKYWAFEAHGGGWYRFEGEGWEQRGEPPERLEGPADLEVDHSLSAQEIQALIEREEAQLAAPIAKQSAPRVLQELVEVIHQAYTQGDIDLEEGLAQLAEHFLVDHTGRPWSAGLRSRGWYVFEDGAWKPSTEVVSETAYLSTGEPLADPEAAANLAGFLVYHLGELPEELSDAWQPPPWYPQAIVSGGVSCPACQTSNPAESRYCNRCGFPLEAELSGQIAEAVTISAQTAVLRCPDCQAPYSPGQKSCPRCGRPLAMPK